jgi:methylmalonyl-CoA mutase cobalamin-binding domain/chain
MYSISCEEKMADILENLKQAVIQFDKKSVEELTLRAIEEGIDPLEVFNALKEIIGKGGEDFSKGHLFLPHLVGAADALEGGMPIVMEEIKKRGKKVESLGTVVIGTVYGDIHSIGKTMVATLLAAEGFSVKDIGINVPAADFVKAVEEDDVHIVAMSALLTTTAPEQNRVIDLLKKKGLREKVKIMVGGGAITKEFADSIGADGYSGTAPGAVKLAKNMLGM